MLTHFFFLHDAVDVHFFACFAVIKAEILQWALKASFALLFKVPLHVLFPVRPLNRLPSVQSINVKVHRFLRAPKTIAQLPHLFLKYRRSDFWASAGLSRNGVIFGNKSDGDLVWWWMHQRDPVRCVSDSLGPIGVQLGWRLYSSADVFLDHFLCFFICIQNMPWILFR